MAKELIGYYENPTPEDSDRIVAEAQAFVDAKEAQEKGWICVGTIKGDASADEIDEMTHKIAEAFVDAEIDKLSQKTAGE